MFDQIAIAQRDFRQGIITDQTTPAWTPTIYLPLPGTWPLQSVYIQFPVAKLAQVSEKISYLAHTGH